MFFFPFKKYIEYLKKKFFGADFQVVEYHYGLNPR
jgi:hypothetical protein